MMERRVDRAAWIWAGLACVLLTTVCATAAEPERIGPWNRTQLFESPEYEWAETIDGVRSLFYEGGPYRGAPTRVFAYYATPGSLAGDASVDVNLPAVVLVHGGGGTAFREWCELWARRGYAAIAMDLAGHRPVEGLNPHARENRTRLPDGGPDQTDDEKFGSVDLAESEQWPYHAVANVMRAHSLIRSFQEVDSDRTAVTGISWGGYLTCIVAGVDDRFRAAVPVYGCGYLHEHSAWLSRFTGMTDDQRDRWVQLWDPSQYLPRVSTPILFVNGTNDFAYPLDSYMKSYDAVPGTKQLCVTVNMPHSHPAGWAPEEIAAFIDHHLLNKPGLAVAGDPERDGDAARVSCEGEIRSAALHYTTGSEAVNQRSWETLEAVVEGDEVRCPAPPAGATAWFVTLTNSHGMITSTRVMLPASAGDSPDH